MMRQVAQKQNPMSYEQIKDLRPAEFKRYCGVEPETFQRMVELISKRLTRTRRKAGRPPKLSVEDQLLLTLEYWREYRTLFHLAKSWGLHESNVCRVIRRVEDILTKSRAFKLPGKKKRHTLKSGRGQRAHPPSSVY